MDTASGHTGVTHIVPAPLSPLSPATSSPGVSLSPVTKLSVSTDLDTSLSSLALDHLSMHRMTSTGPMMSGVHSTTASSTTTSPVTSNKIHTFSECFFIARQH